MVAALNTDFLKEHGSTSEFYIVIQSFTKPCHLNLIFYFFHTNLISIFQDVKHVKILLKFAFGNNKLMKHFNQVCPDLFFIITE